MTPFDYTQLTKADLVKVLADKHGVEIKDVSKATKASLIDRLNDLEGVTVPQPLGEQAVNEANRLESGSAKKLVGVVINVHVGQTREFQQDVFVSVNGRGYQIQRGKNVQVPTAVYNVLKTAVEKTYTPERDPETRKTVMKGVESLRYPFSVVEKVFK